MTESPVEVIARVALEEGFPLQDVATATRWLLLGFNIGRASPELLADRERLAEHVRWYVNVGSTGTRPAPSERRVSPPGDRGDTRQPVEASTGLTEGAIMGDEETRTEERTETHTETERTETSQPAAGGQESDGGEAPGNTDGGGTSGADGS